MKEFDLESILDLPTHIIVKKISNYYILFAPEYPNWIVVDEKGEKLFGYLQNHSIKESMLYLRDIDGIPENEVISVAQSVLSKIEIAKFYHDASIEQEVDVADITKTIHINLTNNCNLRCKHCYMSAGLIEKQELDHNSLILFVEKITKIIGPTEVVISGGEPLVYRSFFEVVNDIKKLGHRIILFTNGLLIDSTNIDFLKEHVDEVQISMEGISRNCYEWIRGRGNYSCLKATLKLLKSRQIPTTLAITVLDDVLDDVQNNIIPFLEELDYDLINVRINDDIEFSGNMLSFNAKIKLDEKTKKLSILNILDKLSDSGYDVINTQKRNIRFTNCGIGTSININFDGKVYPCSDFRHVFFDLNTDAEIVIEKFNEINKNSTVDAMTKCADCEIKYLCCGGCRIQNFVRNGSFIAPVCDQDYKERKYYQLLEDYLSGK